MNKFYNKVFRNGVIYLYDKDMIDDNTLNVFKLKPEDSIFCGGLVPRRTFYHLGKMLSILRKAGFIVKPQTDEASYNVYKNSVCPNNWVGEVWVSSSNDGDITTIKHRRYEGIFGPTSISD